MRLFRDGSASRATAVSAVLQSMRRCPTSQHRLTQPWPEFLPFATGDEQCGLTRHRLGVPSAFTKIWPPVATLLSPERFVKNRISVLRPRVSAILPTEGSIACRQCVCKLCCDSSLQRFATESAPYGTFVAQDAGAAGGPSAPSYRDGQGHCWRMTMELKQGPRGVEVLEQVGKGGEAKSPLGLHAVRTVCGKLPSGRGHGVSPAKTDPADQCGQPGQGLGQPVAVDVRRPATPARSAARGASS